jgi:Flp pilus assembly protein TadG
MMSWIANAAEIFRGSIAQFRAREDGNIALLFGITLIPISAMVGAALDYNRALELREFMHRENDGAALAIAASDTPNAENVIALLKGRIGGHLGSDSTMITNVGVTTSWVGNSVYTMTTSASLVTTLASLLPGSPRSIPISVTTSVKRVPAVFKWSLPSIRNLSYEAADYNRISVYCYDDPNNEGSKGRRMDTLTGIADNGGTDYSRAELPVCGSRETLSFKLWNVRDSRTTPARWQKTQYKNPELKYENRDSKEYYGFYADITIDPNTRVMTINVSGGRESIGKQIATKSVDVTNTPIVETIFCTTGVDCKPKSQGGLLPNDNIGSHEPQKATGACLENKSIYYGWEDRPPSAGGSDKDYNDIRILVSCPTLVPISSKEVRITR